MNNDDCVLLEFANGDVQVGFREWLKDNEEVADTAVDDDWLRNVIETAKYVQVRWPSCAVEPAARMQRKEQQCTWRMRLAKVVSHGEWTKMCEERKSCKQFNQISLSKSERKFRKRKLKYIQWTEDCENRKNDKIIQNANSIRQQPTETAKNVSVSAGKKVEMHSLVYKDRAVNLRYITMKSERLTDENNKLQDSLIEAKNGKRDNDILKCAINDLNQLKTPANLGKSCTKDRIPSFDVTVPQARKKSSLELANPFTFKFHDYSKFETKPTLETQPCIEGIILTRINEPRPFQIIYFEKTDVVRTATVLPRTQNNCATGSVAVEAGSRVSSAKVKPNPDEIKRPYHCALCDKSYTRREHLKRHKRMIHEGYRYPRRLCDICGAGIINLQKHRKSHMLPDGTYSSTYTCPLCRRTFLKNNVFQRHLRRHCPNRLNGKF